MLLAQLSCGQLEDDAPSTSEQLAQIGVSEDASAVQLLAGCVAYVPGGTTYAVFPYRNPLGDTVAVGPERDRLQPNVEQPPTAFPPGLGAFGVALGSQQGILWQLDGRDAFVAYGWSACDLHADWSRGGWTIAIDAELSRLRVPEDPVSDDCVAQYTIPIRVPAGRKQTAWSRARSLGTRRGVTSAASTVWQWVT